jgi:hypothetical protein
MMAQPRSLRADLAWIEQRLWSAAAELDRTLRDVVAERPVLAVGAATGLGLLLGGALTRGTATLLLGAGARIAGAWLDRELRRIHHPEEEDET